MTKKMITFDEWFNDPLVLLSQECRTAEDWLRLAWDARGKADAEFITSKTVYDNVFCFSPEGLKAISKAILDNKD